ncbi:hypothetical protein ATSB10_10410 [Dyella thiooxydans]|uniref:MobA-like NTP transferase domain-containing protein n=1 Tax=Dyella thiooxydans TaxID=445710 RepID=A0A161J291_9GAMM|nr:nucleotidyltransferase family protein [Dyella thiooxydans]AND68495.1 hypothetical protein ATSB10_10410 [Dyella thiooxydans]
MSAVAHQPVILLLAAGEGARFGGIKQLAPVDGEPMIRRCARQALACGVPVLALLGAHADAVAPVLADLPLDVHVHPGWSQGMGDSLAAGVREVQARHPCTSGVLVTLADQPRIGLRLLPALLQAHARSPRRIIATALDGRAGPPALFPRDDFAALAALTGAHGARGLLQREADRVTRLDPRDHDADLLDIDTPDDLVLATRPSANATARP